MTLRKRKGIGNLKQEALDRTFCRIGFGRDNGPAARKSNE
jgi:hypothetical protein